MGNTRRTPPPHPPPPPADWQQAWNFLPVSPRQLAPTHEEIRSLFCPILIVATISIPFPGSPGNHGIMYKLTWSLLNCKIIGNEVRYCLAKSRRDPYSPRHCLMQAHRIKNQFCMFCGDKNLINSKHKHRSHTQCNSRITNNTKINCLRKCPGLQYSIRACSHCVWPKRTLFFTWMRFGHVLEIFASTWKTASVRFLFSARAAWT